MSNTVAKWALGVSLFSAVMSLVATCTAIRQTELAELAVSDQRAALLMNQRIESCTTFYDLAHGVEENSRAVYYLPESGPLAVSEDLVRENERLLHDVIMDTGRALRRVELLGPTALTDQARRVMTAAHAIHDALLGLEPERRNFVPAHEELESATIAFSAACIAVIGRFHAEDEQVANLIARMAERVDERNAPRTPSD